MRKAFICIWLVAFLVCLLLAERNSKFWGEFARAPVQTDGEITGYGGHSASHYAFWVSKQLYRGTDRSPESGENMFIGRVVKVFYCAGNPTVNALTPPPGDPYDYVRGRCSNYVGNRMLCVSLVLTMIHLAITRARTA